MSKGLEAKNRLVNKCSEYLALSIDHQVAEDFLTIEKELEEKQKFDKFLKRYNLNNIEELDDFFNEKLNKEIEKCSKCKELEALEIIKKAVHPCEKPYSEQFDYVDFGNNYLCIDGTIWLSKEKIELLKKVLL